MRVNQLSLGTRTELLLVAESWQPAHVDAINDQPECAVFWEAISNTYIVKHAAGPSVVTGRADAHTALEAICGRGMPRVCWIGDIQLAGDQATLLIHVHEFPLPTISLPKFPLIVGDAILEKVRRLRPEMRTATDLCAWFAEDCVLRDPYSQTARCFCSNGRSGKKKLEDTTFLIHGASLRLFVTRRADQSGEWYEITKVSGVRGGAVPHPMAIIESNIAFVDASNTSEVVRSAATRALAIEETNKGLLSIWKHYSDLEVGDSRQHARKVGDLRYDSFQEHGERLRFNLSPGVDLSSLQEIDPQSDSLCVSAEPITPTIESVGPEASSEEVRKLLKTLNLQSVKIEQVDVRQKTILARGGRKGLETPRSGYLAVSLFGDENTAANREKALDVVTSGKGPMPHLGLLLEGHSPGFCQPTSKYPALTEEVLRRVFADRKGLVRPPNDRQAEAIFVALNTPDIAIIQGPPGTGKTTVLRAIIERINAVLKDSVPPAGRFLVSSYQHDAVENAIAQLSVNDLPALKRARRNWNASDEDDEETVQDIVDRWRRDLLDKIRNRHPDAMRSVLLSQAQAFARAYDEAPSGPAETAVMLRRVHEVMKSHIPTSICDSLLRLAEAMEQVVLSEDSHLSCATAALERALRALRTTPQAFADDGPWTAYRALSACRAYGIIGRDAQGMLEAVASPRAQPSGDQLSVLEDFKRKSLLELARISRQPLGKQQRPEVAQVLEEVVSACREVSGREAGGAEYAIGSFLQSLEDQQAVEDAVGHYTAVYAATCHGSERLPHAALVASGTVYNTVIIDEAARANPLDLLVPLAKASRRIVLVGDHRQLPQIIEESITNQIKQSDKPWAAVAEERIKESLFERLFADLRKLEARDGVRRVVTLNAQYRMHPDLGNFVNQHFYAKHAGEGFESPRPASDFVHEVPGYGGKPMAWINVPIAMGREEKTSAGSTYRRCEAEVIAAHLKRAMDAQECAGLTFGVIAFYKAQEWELLRALARIGVMQEGERNVFTPEEEYREVIVERDGQTERHERLRVGTVDAFQGKEFDVVFLSLTRSNEIPIDRPERVNSKYGHLVLPNRLCVAMSRQRRLLCVVGDAKMLEVNGAKEQLAPLVAFWDHPSCARLSP
jgi:superfamily I DNA/RNA helicase